MRRQKLSPRFAVVQRLQEKLASMQPEDPYYEVYDKAYELALSDNRKVDKYFMRNVLRDAKSILYRRPKVRRISLNGEIPLLVESLKYDRAICYNPGSDNLDYNSLLEIIHQICNPVHQHAQKVLTCMLDGFDTNETVEHTKLSLSLVKKIRTNIKKELKSRVQL